MKELIAVLAKNSMEEIRVLETEYKGIQVIDMRVWVKDGTEWKPTKKGLCLRRELFPEFVKLLVGVNIELEEQGNDSFPGENL